MSNISRRMVHVCVSQLVIINTRFLWLSPTVSVDNFGVVDPAVVVQLVFPSYIQPSCRTQGNLALATIVLGCFTHYKKTYILI